MPQFFFHVRNQKSYTRDETGETLSDVRVARARACDAAGQILTSELRDGNVDVKLQVQVENDAGARLLTFDVSTRVSEGAAE